MRKKLVLLLLATLLVLSLSLPASAAVVKKGTGAIWAKGNGKALIEGRGSVRVSGNGVLVIKDLAGNARIKVRGYGKKVRLKDGTLVYYGFKGRAYVRGSHIKVKITGRNIRLLARGRGRVILKGQGIYKTRGKRGKWSKQGTVIKF